VYSTVSYLVISASIPGPDAAAHGGKRGYAGKLKLQALPVKAGAAISAQIQNMALQRDAWQGSADRE
jgi:hypothetical protein